MAKTQEAQLTFTLQDQIGVKAANTYYLLVDPAMTITQFAALWASQAGLIDLITSGAIIGGKAELVFPTLGTVGKPAAGSRVEQTGLFTLGNASNTRSFGEDVPSLADSKIVSGHIDLSDTDITNYVTALTTPATLSEFTNNQFLVLNALRTAAVTFRKRRRLERALTLEVG